MVLANLEPGHQDNAVFGVDFFSQVSTTEEWPSLGSSLLTSSTSSTTSTLRLDSPQQYDIFGLVKSRKSTSPVQRRNFNPNRMSTQAPSLAETLRHSYGAQNMGLPISQQQLEQNQINQMNSNGAAKNPKLYKTELCRTWADSGRCNYGERCQYAHGDTEKRPIPRHPKYKTEACQSYHQTGYCPYGPRCHFIHSEEPQLLVQLVAQNAAATAACKAQQQQTLQQQHARNQAHLNGGLQRPNSLFASNMGASRAAAAVGVRGQNAPGVANNGQKFGNSPNAIAAAAAMAAAAFNQQPQLFSKQFQNQLQMFNESMVQSEKRHPKPQGVFGDGSTGDSPIPSSNDSGTESPLGSFSPGCDGTGAYGHVGQTVEWSLADNFNDMSFNNSNYNSTIAPPPGLHDQQLDMIPLNLLPSSMSSDVESGFLSSASSIASNKSVNSPSLSAPWSSGTATTPTAGRLPVFERLSNGP